MKIAANAPAPSRSQAPKAGLEKIKDTNPYAMDEVRLGSAIKEAEGKVSALAQKEYKGQSLALAGAGVALAALASVVGSSVPHPGAAQVIAAAGTMFGGIAFFAAGIWKRDGAEMDKDGAGLQVDMLKSIRESRFEKAEKPEGFYDKWYAALPTQDKLWDAERNVRCLERKEGNGAQLAIFGKSVAAGTALTTVGTLIANHGHEPLSALITTALTGAGGAAAWIAGHNKEKNAFAAQAPARAQVQALQQEYDKLMA